MDEIKEKEAVKVEGNAEADTGTGDKPETTPVIDNANEAAERLERAVEAQKVENDRQEQLLAKRMLGGRTEAGQVVEEPKKMTDREYAEAMERGEVNPLKEDGII